MTVAARRLAPLLLAAVLGVTLAACASDSLSERDARSVRVGQVIAPSYTAAVRGTTSHVMLPSGRADLTLSKPVREIAAQDTLGAAPLRPADGAVAVGVAWTLNLGGYPDTTNNQLAPPQTLFGVPQPVRLWLVTDSTRREIRDVGTLEVPGARARNAAWLVVPAGVRQWRFEVDYAGVVQSADARTGKVTPGRAAPLYEPLPLDRRGSCSLGGDAYTSCGTNFAVGYPYLDGAGWAPQGTLFALLSISIDQNHDAGDVRVAGVRPVSKLVCEIYTFRVYPVTAAQSYAVRGTGRVEDDGKTRTVSLTATLRTGGTA